jgi:hypothetical protein
LVLGFTCFDTLNRDARVTLEIRAAPEGMSRRG